jgi:hypothetical protein
LTDAPAPRYATRIGFDREGMSIRPTRSLIVFAIVSMALALAAPANAAGPQAGCPPAFQGPLTFDEIIRMWPPPPDFPDPVGALAAYDVNGDELLCVQEHTHGPLPNGPINVIDNFAAM